MNNVLRAIEINIGIVAGALLVACLGIFLLKRIADALTKEKP